MTKCNICKKELNDPKSILSEDLGGDCLECMIDIGLDIDAAKILVDKVKEMESLLKKN